MSSAPPSSVLLIGPQQDFFADVVHYHFTGAGRRVVAAHDPLQTLRAFDVRGTAIVILDAALPNAQTFLDRIKLFRATNPIPVLAHFPREQPPEQPGCLRIRADHELAEPFEVFELLTLAEREFARALAAGRPREQLVRFLLPSTQADLDRATALAASLLRSCGLDEGGKAALLTAFREAVGNAVQHGNRRDPAKTVAVQYREDADRLIFVVEDQGEGFDYHAYLHQAGHKDAAEAARERHRQGGVGGLGILMMVRCTDCVEYSEKGNAITLTKLLRRPSTGSGRGEPVEPRPPAAEPKADRA